MDDDRFGCPRVMLWCWVMAKSNAAMSLFFLVGDLVVGW